MKRFQAVVNWAKVKGSHLVVCYLPALSTAGSWLVYSSASIIDGVQGFGAQKLVKLNELVCPAFFLHLNWDMCCNGCWGANKKWLCINVVITCEACWATLAEALRFGGICTKQNDGSILAYLWDQGKPLLTQTTCAILGERIFSLRYFCSLCLWYADMLHCSYHDIWKDIAWHM